MVLVSGKKLICASGLCQRQQAESRPTISPLMPGGTTIMKSTLTMNPRVVKTSPSSTLTWFITSPTHLRSSESGFDISTPIYDQTPTEQEIMNVSIVKTELGNKLERTSLRQNPIYIIIISISVVINLLFITFWIMTLIQKKIRTTRQERNNSIEMETM
jgi:hypothetical protein